MTKTAAILFRAAHAYVAHTREYAPLPGVHGASESNSIVLSAL